MRFKSKCQKSSSMEAFKSPGNNLSACLMVTFHQPAPGSRLALNLYDINSWPLPFSCSFIPHAV